ncbi:MAG: FAD assembly factor SdhE [Alphaproteobacteria bacterium]
MSDAGCEAPEGLALRRKRLCFRCWHRGTKEIDLLLGPFAERFTPEMQEAELSEFEHLLTLPDPDLYGWITRQSIAPPENRGKVLDRIINFHNDE